MTTNTQRFALLGIRLPVHGEMANGRVIVDADGHSVAMVLPCNSPSLERARSAAILDALNRMQAEDAEAAAERSAA